MEEKITNHTLRILGLYRSDYTRRLHLRAMAKLLGTGHGTLLPHLRRLEEDKILVGARAGKNKEYSLNLNNILARDYVALAEKFEAIRCLAGNFTIKKLTEELSRLGLEGAVVLFGSYAKDYATEASDIDLFYLGRLQEDKVEAIRKFGKIYGKEIDVKQSTVEHFKDGLIVGDALVKEVIGGHIVLQNPDPFVNVLWRHYLGR